MKYLFILILCYFFELTSPSLFLKEPSLISRTPTLRSLSSETKDLKCFYVDTKSYSVYKLHDLQKNTSHDIYHLTSNNNSTYYFNFCKDVEYEQKKYLNSTFVNCNDLLSNECSQISNSINSENVSSTINIVKDKETTILIYSLGQIAGRPKVTFKITCNPNIEEFVPHLTEDNNAEIIIEGTHKTGCEIQSFYSVTKFLENHWYLTTIVTIITGIFLCFFGSTFINISMVIILGFAVPVVLSIFILVLVDIQSSIALWAVYISGIVVGIILGILIAKFDKYFGAIIGGVLGYLANIFVYNIAIRYIKTSNPQVMYYIILVLCIIICGLVGFFFINKAKIIGTSVIGGYSIIRGISFVGGGFLSEQIIFDLISQKEMEQLENNLSFIMFSYLGGWLFLNAVGCFFQFKFTAKSKSKVENKQLNKSNYQLVSKEQQE